MIASGGLFRKIRVCKVINYDKAHDLSPGPTGRPGARSRRVVQNTKQIIFINESKETVLSTSSSYNHSDSKKQCACRPAAPQRANTDTKAADTLLSEQKLKQLQSS